jgi:hypothetical protein
MPLCLPSDVIDADIEYGIGEIATDTETSGLFADDGARVSTASIAWVVDPEQGWDEWANRYDNVTYGLEEIAPGYEVYIVSIAWPFDQGIVDKPEVAGTDLTVQDSLFGGSDVNLPEDEWWALLGLLSHHDLIMHNGPFDCEKYRVGTRKWPGRELINRLVWDTQNVNDFLWRLEPTSLKPTVARIFGKEWADEAAIVKSYLAKAKLPAGRWDLMPWDVIGKYADTDARITLMLKLRQEWEINANEAGSWVWDEGEFPGDKDPRDAVYDVIERRLEVSKVTYAMTRRGVPYDEVTSRQAAIECRQRAKNVADRLPFGPTDAKAKHYFFEEGVTDKGVECLNNIPYQTTDKGAPSMTAEVLGRMVEDEVPYADVWAEYRRLSNAASMWYEGYAEAIGTDGRLRTYFRVNGTRSTRFSVERLNLQAIPQDYRLSDHQALDGIITPRGIIANAVPEGWRLGELDLAQAELRIGTMFAKCQLMEQMIRDGEDLHSFTTKALFPHVPEDDPLFHSKWRQVGKRGNFSLQFGAKGPTFMRMVSKETGIRLTEQEAIKIVRDWNALYPEFGRAIRKHQAVVERRQTKYGYAWIDLVNGERRWFQQYEEAHKAFNQRVQANLGQFAIDWMLMTERFLVGQKNLQLAAKAANIGEPGLLLTVHDSQLLLLPDDDYGQSIAERCAQFGRDLWKQMFPKIPGDVDYKAWKRVTA